MIFLDLTEWVPMYKAKYSTLAWLVNNSYVIFQDKEALVKSDVSIPVAGSEAEVEIESGHERSGSRILSCVSHSCLLVTAIIALTVGVIGAFHVYRTVSQTILASLTEVVLNTKVT